MRRQRSMVAMAATALALGVGGCGGVTPGRVAGPVASALASRPPVESYALCDPERLAANCVVVADRDNLVWLTRAANGEYVAVHMAACESDDGPAPCIWDSRGRGDGSSDPGLSRFLVIRD